MTIILFVVPLYIDSFVTISSLLYTKLMEICERKEKPAKVRTERQHTRACHPPRVQSTALLYPFVDPFVPET